MSSDSGEDEWGSPEAVSRGSQLANIVLGALKSRARRAAGRADLGEGLHRISEELDRSVEGMGRDTDGSTPGGTAAVVKVWNIHTAVTAQQLAALLGRHGEVARVSLPLRRSGGKYSRATATAPTGQAFVTFCTAEGAAGLLEAYATAREQLSLLGRTFCAKQLERPEALPHSRVGLWRYRAKLLQLGCYLSAPGGIPGLRCHWLTTHGLLLEVDGRQREVNIFFRTAPGGRKHKAVLKMKSVVRHAEVEGDPKSGDVSVSLTLAHPARLFRASGSHLGGPDPPGPCSQPAVENIFLYDSNEETAEHWLQTSDFTPAGAFGHCLMYRLSFAASEAGEGESELLHALGLFSLCPVPPFYTLRNVEHTGPPNLSLFEAQLRMLPFSLGFALARLVSTGVICAHALSPALLACLGRAPPHAVAEVLEVVALEGTVIHGDVVILLDGLLRRISENMQPGGDPLLAGLIPAEPSGNADNVVRLPVEVQEQLSVQQEVPEQCARVYRALVTPTRVLLRAPEVEVSNRVLRRFRHVEDRFLRVTFVTGEEDGLFGMAGQTDIFRDLRARVRQAMGSGIQCAGRHYEFLAYSSSQLRECSAWFFSPTPEDTTRDVLEWMGDFRALHVVAKCAARMGQCFSRTVEVVPDCRRLECLEIGDVTMAGYTFSDGVGIVSAEVAVEAAWKMHQQEMVSLLERVGMERATVLMPSAMQIRYKGYKGVLTVDPRQPGTRLCLRPSMNKFPCPHSHALEVVRLAKYGQGYMNRQIILLLSTLGIPDEEFLSLQRRMTQSLDKMLVSAMDALATIEGMGDSGSFWARCAVDLLQAGVPVGNPHLQHVLKVVRSKHLHQLKNRARLLVPEAANLMGVMDETGRLEYGQVFVKIRKAERFDDHSCTAGREKTVTGPVVVLKNPCFHPGDCRRLEAVDVPELHHLTNVLVFPARGPRPHTDECSGSDLDGDTYFVTWRPSLIPIKETLPMDYTPGPVAAVDGQVQRQHLIDFFMDFSKNSSIGQIANAHLVLSDESPLGAMDHRCLQLAMLHSEAVDMAKTGTAVRLPPALRPKRYPDFMQKMDRESYESQKVLGQLYRQIAPSDLRSPDWSVVSRAGRPLSSEERAELAEGFDEQMLWPGHEAFLDRASRARDRYHAGLLRLMSLYSVYTEGELVTGMVLRFQDKTMRMEEEFDTQQRIGRAMQSLRRSAHQMCFEDIEAREQEAAAGRPPILVSDPSGTPWTGGLGSAIDDRAMPQEGMRMAAAMYRVCYHPSSGNLLRLYSFPWVAYRYLMLNKRVNAVRELERPLLEGIGP